MDSLMQNSALLLLVPKYLRCGLVQSSQVLSLFEYHPKPPNRDTLTSSRHYVPPSVHVVKLHKC